MFDLTGGDILAASNGQAADLAQQLDAVTQQMSAVTTAMSGLAQQEVRGSSQDGLVTATVTGVGALTKVYVNPRAIRNLDHTQIGEAAVEAIQAARVLAAQGLTSIVTELVPQLPADQLPGSDQMNLNQAHPADEPTQRPDLSEHFATLRRALREGQS